MNTAEGELDEAAALDRGLALDTLSGKQLLIIGSQLGIGLPSYSETDRIDPTELRRCCNKASYWTAADRPDVPSVIIPSADFHRISDDQLPPSTPH